MASIRRSQSGKVFGVGGGIGNDEFTKLLLQSDTTDGSTTFVDTSVGGGGITLIANGSIQHSNTQAKFGGSSIYSGAVVNNTDYITTLAAETRGYSLEPHRCIDFWRYDTSTAQGKDMSWGGTNPRGWWLYNSGTSFVSQAFMNDNSFDQISLSGAISIGMWRHYCYAFVNTVYHFYIDGVYKATSSAMALPHKQESYTSFGAPPVLTINSAPPIASGSGGNYQSPSGYFEEFRLSIGRNRILDDSTDPLYISSGNYLDGFTPPAAPYEAA